MSTKLFVGNLSFNTTENDLQDAFAAHGTVVEANIMVDRMSGRPRGFAFVTMGTPEEAQKAIEAMNGATLDSRQLTVNIARPREERASAAREPDPVAQDLYIRCRYLMDRQTEAALRVFLDTSRTRATGYRLYLFYPS